MPVHLFGLAADMDPIMAIAKKYGLWVVEDAACGFGATYGGQHVGYFGNAGAFSFHPRKAITTGEGGMVTTTDEALSVKIQQLRDHGAVLSDLQRHLGPKPYLLADHIHAGYNQRMTDIQEHLELPKWIEQRVLSMKGEKLLPILINSLTILSGCKHLIAMIIMAMATKVTLAY